MIIRDQIQINKVLQMLISIMKDVKLQVVKIIKV